jgi:hypothetical protein
MSARPNCKSSISGRDSLPCLDGGTGGSRLAAIDSAVSRNSDPYITYVIAIHVQQSQLTLGSLRFES